ncbi:hypothetical protein BJ875DRAFT_241496 [Amylocarpus encephaloides]|uniref:Uncharacterized protein n=1 Tax=Amylocarpus encephaloides TaxID=45428 RepID=A0A9P7YNA3_9HELO|nr:hypothetical protein BJ875DRAFT_241496 [Amylocarpus encephaloides]
MGNGESYRPAARPRSPPRADTYRTDRDRARTPPASDSWHPNSRNRSPRRRSRSPMRRDRSPLRDNWRARARSPRARSPSRRFSPRRDDDRRARSPPRRDERRRTRSPFDRSRPPRNRSPISRRSPPTGPRGTFRPRSRSPDRRDDRRDRTNNRPSSSNWRRPRSPSPQARDSERSSGRTSESTSRRSSPHVHPDRLPLTQAASRDSRANSPPIQRARSPPQRARSPPSSNYRERESARSTPGQRSPRPQRARSPPTQQLAYRDRETTRALPRERSPVRSLAKSPPRGPASFRAPTGPSSGRNFTAPAQSPSAPLSVSAHSKHEHAAPSFPPSGPRGFVGSTRGGGFMRGGRGSFVSEKPSRPEPWGSAPPIRTVPEASPHGSTPATRPTPTPSPSLPSGPSVASIPTGPAAGIPTGPRAGVPTRPLLQHSSSTYSSRTAANIAAGPRPHPAMANLPQIIPNGRFDPTASGVSSDLAARLKKREEEAEILREELNAKQEKLRQSLKGWDKLSRDSASMGLKSELSERHVRMLAGEGVGGAAF